MKISVLTPSYNSAQYIRRAIESVISQNYDNYEHIVVDGGSKDGTVEILKEFPQVKYISEKDKGQSDAMNKAFSMSSGEIIVYLNADDEFLPLAFSKIIAAFEQNTQADMVVGNLIYKTEDESIIRNPSCKYRDIILYWLNAFPNNPVSYFYKRKVQNNIGKFPIDDHFAMDIWFLLKAYKNNKIIKIEETLGIFHSDGTNKTAIADTGYHLHKTVKNHLIKDNPLMLIYFYFKFFRDKKR
ncbi:glycosyltransferase family 2 protein [Pedobacter aquatilis]|uniref:glycosyltransferase family 2 protein n=1 Tax=Pedobacter aquatilis TaxID=351343 RepID=UPI00292EB2EF|nr:glycosyltransferase family 2 protein [Pedobacter aquatilis]